ncbi:hypothetical protein ABS768_02580 [Flavobacterium sp. ST-75]|uniref:Uncharacterized protein n=1 Tax=Flavobacterium rhizophilum TaxID=3163296 RepID=A0ABW8Y864_9FLAO
MRKLDVKHAAFHVLVAVYFLWVIVIGVLVAMAMYNYINTVDAGLNQVFFKWIIYNFLTGTMLLAVIRMFRQNKNLKKVILYSYTFMLGVSVTTLLMIKG